jgi:hypothetical protein
LVTQLLVQFALPGQFLSQYLLQFAAHCEPLLCASAVVAENIIAAIAAAASKTFI